MFGNFHDFGNNFNLGVALRAGLFALSFSTMLRQAQLRTKRMPLQSLTHIFHFTFFLHSEPVPESLKKLESMIYGVEKIQLH